ncbi:DUF262 domain-containing protein [Clostridium perfringens]|uniref:DUF262 domain-containing protein n=1 Tax=Clostridium perfringens TaxID=1502 RepID=UPI002247AC30|nr:DUF262 domain-containing protein [Clostridium perfringens]MCX0399716.1 DUF262 domain-containing protein [Clostridium perfringens]
MKIEDSSSGLGNLIAEKDVEFYIPLNQRKYSWEKEQVEDYYNDLLKVINEKSQHYMGVITMIEVEKKKKKQYKIVDGQQRIITTIILLCVLRDLSMQYYRISDINFSDKFLDLALQIQKEYLSFKLKDGEWQLKLAPCKYDRDLLIGIMDLLSNKGSYHTGFKKDYLENEAYIDNMLEMTTNEDESFYVNPNIVNTYKEFESKIKADILEDNEIKFEKIDKRLKLWFESIDKIKVFGLTSSNEGNLFDYFESLNTKGLKLSQVDLVRNKLFKVISNSNNFDKSLIEDISDVWDNIIANIDEVDPVKFLKYFYMCEKKQILKYGDIPNYFEILFEENICCIENFIDKIEVYSIIYKYLNNESLYDGFSNEHYYLKYLGQEACYSFLMYLIYNYKKVDYEFCKNGFKYVEKIIFFRILTRKSVKELDELFKNLIKFLDENKDNKNKIFDLIDKEIDSYGNIEEYVDNRKWKNEKLLRYIIMKYNNITFNKEDEIKSDIKIKRINNDDDLKYNIGNYILKGSKDNLNIYIREKKYKEIIKNLKSKK